MIRKLLQWLFKKEYQEAKELLEQAKLHAKKVYVKYDAVEFTSPKFLYGMQTTIDSEMVIVWLNERKKSFEDSIKYHDRSKRLEYIGSAIAIDILIKDLDVFKQNYTAMIEQQAEMNKNYHGE